MKTALHISVGQLRRSKAYLLGALLLGLVSAQAAHADGTATNAQCIGTHTISLMMALDCDYASPEEPQCFTDHLGLYSSDLATFTVGERDVLAWMTAYSEGRGYKVGGLFDELCEPAMREIEDGTDIGTNLRPME